jgi:hypothetical protein
LLEEFDMRMIELTCALANPDKMGRTVVATAGERIDA